MVAGAILSGRAACRGSDRAAVLILDEYPTIGGNHISVDIGDYTYDIGSFIFSETSQFLAHFPELLPLYHPAGPGGFRPPLDRRPALPDIRPGALHGTALRREPGADRKRLRPQEDALG